MKYIYAFFLSVAFLFSSVGLTYADNQLRASAEQNWDDSKFKQQVEAVKEQEYQNDNKGIQKIVNLGIDFKNVINGFFVLIGLFFLIYKLNQMAKHSDKLSPARVIMVLIFSIALMSIGKFSDIMSTTVVGNIDCPAAKYSACKEPRGFLGLEKILEKNSPILSDEFIDMAEGIFVILRILGFIFFGKYIISIILLFKDTDEVQTKHRLPEGFAIKVICTIFLMNITHSATMAIDFVYSAGKMLGV